MKLVAKGKDVWPCSFIPCDSEDCLLIPDEQGAGCVYAAVRKMNSMQHRMCCHVASVVPGHSTLALTKDSGAYLH